MKLNPEKCTFRVASSKFLGYLVTQRGIEANSIKISAILEMKSPTYVKKGQILNGHLIALNWLLSRSNDKCKPFFQAIKKNGTYLCWDERCEQQIFLLPQFEGSSENFESKDSKQKRRKRIDKKFKDF